MVLISIVKIGDQTTLMVDKSINPPAYYFTPPVPSLSSQGSVQVVNDTDLPQNIGFGFITDLNTDQEEMHTLLMFPHVKPTCTALAQYIPVVRAYISMNYAQDELISPDIKNIKPLWERDMRELQSSTTIVVKRTPQGTYEAHELPGILQRATDEPDSAASLQDSIESKMPSYELSFHATIVFRGRANCEQHLKFFAADLIRRGYAVKLHIKDGGDDIGVELLLPFGVSCAQAEKHLRELGANEQGYTIKQCGGELHVFQGEHVSCCYDISPASREWFAPGTLYR